LRRHAVEPVPVADGFEVGGGMLAVAIAPAIGAALFVVFVIAAIIVGL
jgi:hypothetical protein